MFVRFFSCAKGQQTFKIKPVNTYTVKTPRALMKSRSADMELHIIRKP